MTERGTPEVPRLAHVAVAVWNLDGQTAVPAAALGLSVRRRTTVPSEDAAVAFMPVGQAEVELVQPLSAGGSLRRFLDRRGEAIHHMALRVPDVAAAVEAASHAGLPLAGQAIRTGAHGTRVAFVHPSSLNGVMIELIEDKPRGGGQDFPK